MLRFILHYGIHFIVPIIIALFLFKKNKGVVMLILLSGIIIDIDHFFSNPIFDPNRCSINFHPLHSYIAIFIYFSFLFFKKTRIYGIALLIHILADMVDCYMINLN
ncbi:DUF6122 family protein [uncultured Maribacter sp.]|uniref:DUF6122 family protein n=1 Tax=uncultured Maribacter sp. TaxID=431308 RepID=UPI002613D1C1|nr:DUF6122 family protein [uncultured Maribacter sp.]